MRAFFLELIMAVMIVGFLPVMTMRSVYAETPPPLEETAAHTITNDPFEPVNRSIFDVNDFLDRLLLRPLAELDRALLPPEIRDRIVGILRNMREPVVLTNNLLQGEFDRAGITAERFAINTTLGVGGMFDWANEWELYQQKGDFGQTLYVWGVDSGPYLVLPLFGPSNVRDAVGVGVDTLMSPWPYAVRTGGTSTYDTFEIVNFGMGGITKREQNIDVIDALRSGSLDFYAQMRSAYNQHRNHELGVEGMLVSPVMIP